MTDQNSQIQNDALMQLVKDLGIDTLSQDKQNELVIKMTEVLLKRIFLETMEKLGEQGRMDYEALTETDASPEKIEEFFKQHIPDYEVMVEQVVSEFKSEMMTANQ